MKRLFFLLLFILFVSGTATADSIDSTQVGPGVIHYHEYRDSGPWNFNILKIDLTNDWLKVETVKANDLLKAHERTSSMAARNDYEMHRVVGAVNGDFYDGNGTPIGTQVINGEILKSTNDWENIAFDMFKRPMIENVNFSGSVSFGDSSFSINSVNEERQQNNLVLYNSFFGENTLTNQWGAEVLLNPLNEWIVNDTLYCIAENIIDGVGNMLIPKGKAVLSGHGISRDFINNNFHIGDTVKVNLKLLPGFSKMNQLIGGNNRLVINGNAVGVAGNRHPRTSIGFDRDSTTLYLFTVDGRQTGFSIGMTQYELSEYMVEWGVYQGINLDGGGSTTMVIRGDVANSPSDDGGERSVANSIMIVSTAPSAPLSLLRISPAVIFTAAGSTVQFSAAGFDQYFNPVSFNIDSLTWSADSSIGSITSAGLFTAAGDTLEGYVYAEVGNIIDSALVKITMLTSISLEPNPIILEAGYQQQIIPHAVDNYGNTVNLSLSDYTWTVDGDVGMINDVGLFTATGTGQGIIIASFNGVEGTASVTVGIPSSVVIDNFNGVQNYSLSGVNVNMSESNLIVDSLHFISSPTSGKLEYSLMTGGTSALYMNCNIPISGSPDKVGINIYGDGKGHWLRGEFADADGEKFLINFTEADPGIDWITSWRYVEKQFGDAIPSWSNPGAVLNFPVKWTKIYLVETNESKKNSGAIFLDDFMVDYIVSGVDDNPDYVPDNFQLMQNYPNPFNPSTTIKYNIPGTVIGSTHVFLKVFDILGNEVAVLVDAEKSPGQYTVEFNADNLSSGVYFYRLIAGTFSESKKLMLIK